MLGCADLQIHETVRCIFHILTLITYIMEILWNEHADRWIDITFITIVQMKDNCARQTTFMAVILTATMNNYSRGLVTKTPSFPLSRQLI